MFTGRDYDTSTGLYYYRARWYNPDIGRFMQVDPIYYLDGFDLYTYVGNNPVNFVDPLGKSECEEWKKVKDTDDGCGGLLNTAQCAQCCVEKFVKKVPFGSWPWKWPGWFEWMYGCKSACAASGGQIGPDLPTP